MKAVKSKKLLAGAMVLAVLLMLPAAASADGPCPCGDSEAEITSQYLDIGNTASEAGHNLQGWGPPEPATHGGNWGSIAPGDCRVTWEPPNAKNGLRHASFKMTVPADKIATKLELRVLDGLADDSFEVYVNNVLKYTHTGEKDSIENWNTHSISLPNLRGTITVKIKATGPAWASFSTYGQLGVDWAKLYGCNALDYVDIGSGVGKDTKLPGWGWGPVEPATHGGTWGGIAPGSCRVIWENGTGDLNRSALIKMTVPKGQTANTLKLRVLDGQADDSYAVLVNNQLVHWATLSPGGGENWITHSIPLPGGVTGTANVVIIALGPAWGSHGTYGQVAFDWAALCP